MPKIIKNGKEYSGVPIEVVTAWAPTADPVQVKEPLMGNTDISSIGDGTVTGAIDELNTGLTNLFKHIVITGTTDSAGNIQLTGVSAANNFVVSVVSIGGYPAGLVTSGNVLYAKILTNNNPVTPAVNTNVTLYVTYI